MSVFATLSTQVLKVGGSGIVGQAITFLSLPVISRLYAPEAFGAWALFMSAAAMIGAVATLRYELAVVLPDRDGAAAALVMAGAAAALATAALAAIALPWLSPWLTAAGDTSGNAVWLLPLFVLTAAAYQLGLAWNTRRAFFGSYSLGQFALPAATALVQIGAALLGANSAGGLILGSLAGYLVGAVLLWAFATAADRKLLSRGISARRAAASARRYYKYPLFTTPYTLLGAARDRVVYFVLGVYVGGATTGHYALAQRFTNIPNSLVASAVRPVFFQFAARRELAGLAPAVIVVMAALILLTVPNVAVFLFFAGPILGFLFGSDWVAAAPYASLLAIPAMPLLLGNWMDRIFDVRNRQDLAFHLEAVFSVATIAALLLGFVLTGEPLMAVALQASAMFVYFSVWIAIAFRVAGFPGSAAARVGVFAFSVAAVAAGVLWGLTKVLPPLPAAVAFYALYLVVLFPVAWRLYRRISTDLG